MTDDALNRFATALAGEVDDARDDPALGLPSTEAVFTRLILQQLEDAGQVDEAFDLPQEGRVGRATFRISGYALNDDEGDLTLFTTAWTGTLPPERMTASELGKVADRASAYVSACLNGLADKIEPSNTEASDLARRVAAIGKGLRRLKIVILTDAIASSLPPAVVKWDGREVEIDLYDIVRLQRVLGEGETRSDIVVDFAGLAGGGLACLPVAHASSQYEAYLAAIPGEILSKVYDRYGVRLLELNVRAFLGVAGRKSVNAQLRKTLIEQPAMFLAFNNGLVATADDIVLEKQAGSARITSIRGLQIVNGGQTTASLHRARRKESASLADVEVPIKIIRVTDGDLEAMVTSISKAANHQNPVQQADFSANDPFHQEIEALANNVWLDDGRRRWFYERARGSYLAAEQKAGLRLTDLRQFKEQTPKSRRLSKLDMARYLAAWDGLPWRVGLGGQKNFHLFMQARKDGPASAVDPAWFRRLIALAVLYRTTERLVRAARFPAYGANIVAYTVAALSERTGGRIDFEFIWRHQAVSRELEHLLVSWAPQIESLLRDSAGVQNPTEWFKKEACWTDLRSRLPNLADPLPAELAGAVTAPRAGASAIGQVGLSASDYAQIERCMQTSSADWIQTAEVGQKQNLIHYRVAGICMTLAGYAAGGWVKRPSIKQAKHALDALDLVRNYLPPAEG